MSVGTDDADCGVSQNAFGRGIKAHDTIAFVNLNQAFGHQMRERVDEALCGNELV